MGDDPTTGWLTHTERDEIREAIVSDLTFRTRGTTLSAIERIGAAREARAMAAARGEALTVAAISLQRIVDYWDGRPLSAGHGVHLYADLLDVLRAIKADAALVQPADTEGAER
jgi:hypothetical protein